MASMTDVHPCLASPDREPFTPTTMNTLSLIERLAAQERRLQHAVFLAPVVAGGSVRVRVEGLVYTFRLADSAFEGWGLLRARDAATAEVVGAPRPAQVGDYWRRLQRGRLRLAFSLHGRTWLAVPAFPSDARTPQGEGKLSGGLRPVPVHLVERARPLARIVARWDGGSFWFEAVDRRADPHKAEALREALRRETTPEALRVPHLTPEDRAAYACAWHRTHAARRRRQDVREGGRLREALARGGGRLEQHDDLGDAWRVRWTTAAGEPHVSVVRKRDLTVLSAGLCLSDRDKDFDLTALVGVVEDRPDWMR
ncbi:MAG: hypothetical protein ACR2GR_04455 [Rhodothermales bacterium]